MQFALVSRLELDHLNSLFEAACAARAIPFAMICAGQAALAPLAPASAGRMLYCAAADRASVLLEKLLFTDGTAALHDPHFICDHPEILFRQRGLPTPRTVFAPAPDDAGLLRQVEWLGGWPVVVKQPGLEGGRGVALAHTLTALKSIPPGALIQAFIPHQRSWRVTVLGDQALASTAMRPPTGDFRANAPGFSIDAAAAVPAGLEALAISAVAALRLDFGGVDIIEREDGALALCEVNFPCAFDFQQQANGVDIAGAIVEYLARKL